MLEIHNLHVSVDGQEILKGLDLTINAGEVHAIMGPNGSGKSTLASVIAGRSEYAVSEGTISYQGRNLLEMNIDERAREGIFLAFQYPVELPGVRNRQFIKSALDSVYEHRGQEPLSARDFDKLYKEKISQVGIDSELVKRSVNDAFSGGEKKRNEMLQLAILDPKLAVLDETDSGLDIDALKAVADSVNARRSPDKAIVLVTHYHRILRYVVPDVVHVLIDGKIVTSGGKELAIRLEETGYEMVASKNHSTVPGN